MTKKIERELTTLEYLVLGVLSFGPQTGYSIILMFEMDYWRGSTSPGSVYPILKRLEQSGIIEGEVEMVHEARSRKMYQLTNDGEDLLDEWLNAPFDKSDVAEEYNTVLMKFMFAERRFTHEQVMDFLARYERGVDEYMTMLTLSRFPSDEVWSLHQQLILEANLMELNMQRTWIQMARQRLQMSRNQAIRATQEVENTDQP